MSDRRSYALVTPAHNEAANLPGLAEALLSQSLPFARWVIVDDASTDETWRIASEIAESDARITLTSTRHATERKRGLGGIVGFNQGLRTIGALEGFDYVGNIDADILVGTDYYDRLLAEFAARPRLGIAGGHCYERKHGRLVLDRVPDVHVRGATKTYRRECLDAIWPLAEVPAWDSVDEVRAWGFGWETRSFLEPRAEHRRPVTGGTGGLLVGRFVLGKNSHFLGYLPAYFGLRIVREVARPPYVFGAAAMAAGYLAGVAGRQERIDDEFFRSCLTRYQRERMRGLTRRARVRDGAGTDGQADYRELRAGDEL